MTTDLPPLGRAILPAYLKWLRPRRVPYGLSAAWAVMLALLWRFEAPNLLHTLVTTLTTLGLGLLLIELGERLGYVTSRNTWIVAFLLKLTLSFLITSYLWAEPLTKLGLLRVPAAVPGVQDSNLYDYQALQALLHGFQLQYLNFVWQSFGVVTYIASIYKIFGISVWYVSLGNTLLSLLGVLALTGILTTIDPTHRRQWRWLSLAMLIPYVAYYDATPAKEPLSFGLFYFTLLFIVRMSTRQGVLWRNALLVLLGLALLALVRPNVALMLLIPNVLVVIMRLGVKRGLVLLGAAVLLVVSVTTLTGNLARITGLYFNPKAWLVILGNAWAVREAGGDHPLKLLVGNLLLPRTFTSLVLLAPVRAVVWFFLPYPLIVPDWATLFNLRWLLVSDPLAYFRFGADFPALLSTWLLIISSPFLAAAVFTRRTWQNPGFQVLLLNLISILLIISNLQFIMGRRYRTLLEPLIMAIALWGGVHGQPNRYKLVFYSILVGGVVLVEVISTG